MLDSFQVMDGSLSLILHYMFSFLLPPYIPFIIVYFLTKEFTICSLTNTCPSLTLSSYLSKPQFYVLYIALIVGSAFWALVLAIVDTINEGGSIKSLIGGGITAATENRDEIVGEDSDVREERDVVDALMEEQSVSSATPVIAVKGLRKVFAKDGGSGKMSCCQGYADTEIKVA